MIILQKLPIGLRPPSYYFNYAPIVIQALFHITAFQSAVLSFRPVPADWGTPDNYWKGQGECIPGYITIEKKTAFEQPERITKKQEEEEEKDYNNIDENDVQEGLSESPQEEIVEREVKAIPKCLQTLGEMQKLFAFLGNTKRGYGSVSDYTKALNTRTNFWDEDDVHFESFLDLLINRLLECDVLSNVSSLKQKFKSYKSDTNDCGSTYKYTSFETTSPILFIVLENRHKLNYEYQIDTTIYLDRYMDYNKEQSIQGFQKMQTYQMDIKKSQAEIDKLKGDIRCVSKRDLLDESIKYFKDKQESDINDDDLNALDYILKTVKQKMTIRLEQMETLLKERKREIYAIFDREDMKKKPYKLRATFHHDGKTGTGHYWAYIWVESKEENLLEDIPAEGGWFRFCDASVIPAKEEDIFNDPVPPFSFVYVDDSLPHYTKNEIYECVPDELKQFIKQDNVLFEQEISMYDRTSNAAYPIYDDNWFTEKTEEYQIEQTTFDDTNSIGTAVGQTYTDTDNKNINCSQKFIGQGYAKLKDQANHKIIETSGYASDDYRLLMNFETFLAKSQNQMSLEHLYLLYTVSEDGDQCIKEEASKDDEVLKPAWHQYECYLSVGERVTQALYYFVKQEYQIALQLLLDAKRAEAAWKTRLMLDLDMLNAYSGIDTISFSPLYEAYGKKCLEVLNKAAFAKALNESYRSRGLEDALRLAHQAHAIIGPDAISNDSTYESLRELWLRFGEQDNSNKLTDDQANLLNTLVMTYLEGQSGQSGEDVNKAESLVFDASKECDDRPLWERYKQISYQAEQLLKEISS
ncbi:hypothetical protein G6F36_011119 [Rhizopus arrhizus]|nr:hypothetical protein G6F36_011119 [Rhizopus arrhizus]